MPLRQPSLLTSRYRYSDGVIVGRDDGDGSSFAVFVEQLLRCLFFRYCR